MLMPALRQPDPRHSSTCCWTPFRG